MSRLLEVYHGSDGQVRSALVKTEVVKLKRPVLKLVSMFYESVFREKKQGRKCWPENVLVLDCVSCNGLHNLPLHAAERVFPVKDISRHHKSLLFNLISE